MSKDEDRENLHRLLDELPQESKGLEEEAQFPTNEQCSRPSYFRIIEKHLADIPADVLEQLPTDLAEQHDHYIYGTPKRPSRP